MNGRTPTTTPTLDGVARHLAKPTGANIAIAVAATAVLVFASTGVWHSLGTATGSGTAVDEAAKWTGYIVLQLAVLLAIVVVKTLVHARVYGY